MAVLDRAVQTGGGDCADPRFQFVKGRDSGLQRLDARARSPNYRAVRVGEIAGQRVDLILAVARMGAEYDWPVGDAAQPFEHALAPGRGHRNPLFADAPLRQDEDVIPPLAPRLLGDRMALVWAEKPAPATVMVPEEKAVIFRAIGGAGEAVFGDDDAGTVRLVKSGDRFIRTRPIPKQHDIIRSGHALPSLLDDEPVTFEPARENASFVVIAAAKEIGRARPEHSRPASRSRIPGQ